MEELIGRTLGQYQIIERLGEGGMGAVYKAYQPNIDRCVAIKILLRQLADDPQFVDRFVQEAKVIARLQHPHIVPIHDFGRADSHFYLVMPLIDGGALSTLLRGGPLPLGAIQHIIPQICEALDYAHAQGVIHRDMKPANILIDRRGYAMISDFGLAKLAANRAKSLTHSSMLVGTPAYMSPEQGLGKPVDGRSDLYSLGVVMFEMATGCTPFDADTPLAILLKAVQEPPPPARSLNPNIPESLNDVILKALEKSPGDRYPSGKALQAAVKNAMANASTLTLPNNAARPPASSDPVSPPVLPLTRFVTPAPGAPVTKAQPTPTPGASAAADRPTPARRTSPATAKRAGARARPGQQPALNNTALILIMLALLGGIIFLFIILLFLQQNRQIASMTALSATAAPSSTPLATASPTGPPTLAPSRPPSSTAIPAAATALATNTPRPTATLTATTSPTTTFPPTKTPTATFPPTKISTATVYVPPSPSGRIVFVSGGMLGQRALGNLYVVNPDGSDLKQLTTTSAQIMMPSWSPDGQRIVFVADFEGNWLFDLYIINADGSGQTRLTNASAEDLNPDWSPDGNLIAFDSKRDGNDEVYVVAPDGGSLANRTNNSASDKDPAWSPDGQKIAFASNRDGNYEIYVMNADGSSVTRLTNTSADERNPAWSPDGSLIAFDSNNSEVWAMNSDGANAHKIIGGAYPSWSPDGKRLVYHTYIVNFDIYQASADGEKYAKLVDQGRDTYPDWSGR